jgi:hypothetical protein
MKTFLKSFLFTSLIASLICTALVCTQAALADEDPGIPTIPRCKTNATHETQCQSDTTTCIATKDCVGFMKPNQTFDYCGCL